MISFTAATELESDETARIQAGVQHLMDSRLPVCVFADGTRMECPTIRQITEKLGWFVTPSRSEYDLAIYGAGPAGLSAAVYGSSDGLKTVLVERWAVGGQAASSSKIENYLGFPEGIGGAELAERARQQACKFGVEILLARKGVRAEFPTGRGVGFLEDGTRIVARASICATGVEYRRLGLPNEDPFPRVLEEITLVDHGTGKERTARTHWLFVCIGGVPQTDWAIEAGMVRDEGGCLVTGPDLIRGRERSAHWPLDRDPFYLETSIPGVFAAGDVRHGSVKRCASAVGEGAMAVASVHRYLGNGR